MSIKMKKERVQNGDTEKKWPLTISNRGYETKAPGAGHVSRSSGHQSVPEGRASKPGLIFSILLKFK